MRAPASPVEALRESIDEVDGQIANLLQIRARFVVALARVKKAEGLPAKDIDRVEAIVARVRATGSDAFSADRVERIQRAIIQECTGVVIEIVEGDR